MSDIESFRSISPLSGGSKTDEKLNDHRNQLPSLPIKAENECEEDTKDSSKDLNEQVSFEKQRKEVTEQPENKSTEREAPSKSDIPFRTEDKGRDHQKRSVTSSSSYSAEDLDEENVRYLSGKRNHRYMNTLRKDFYLGTSEEDNDSIGLDSAQAVPHGIYNPRQIERNKTAFDHRVPNRGLKSRSQSISGQLKAFVNPKNPEETQKRASIPANASILLNPSNVARKSRRRSSFNDNADTSIPFSKIKSNDSVHSDSMSHNRRDRRPSKSSVDSDVDSRASRSSQETEEDVCFPMLKEHIRIKGIDFDEIEEFIKEERHNQIILQEERSMMAHRTTKNIHPQTSIAAFKNSYKPNNNNALKYTPKLSLRKHIKFNHWGKNKFKRRQNEIEKMSSDSSTATDLSIKGEKQRIFADGDVSLKDDNLSGSVKFGEIRVNDNEINLPDRFSFFCSESDETIHAPDIPSLVPPGQTVRELFRNGEATWWLDCLCPTDAEMKMLAKAFGIHPLTAEDIRMQEIREKVELFRNYYFVSFHTFEPDQESEEYLEPINVYMVVFREGVLSFHFAPIAHPANVRRRVRQLRDYVDVSADWICYALIDDITDSFAPVITDIEYEADAIEDSVFVARDLDFSHMLQRIGEARKKVMTLMRLLSGKADVIKMFAKRCYDEAQTTASLPSQVHLNSAGNYCGQNMNGQSNNTYGNSGPNQNNYIRTQPRADIALYLGDIQDHVVTMFQSLLAYEKIFSRSHSNYLAQLQVESFNSNNKVTEILSKVTLIGTMLVPLNLITGLFGMNVNVPGQGDDNPGLYWFFGILGVMIFLIVFSLFLGNIWLNNVNRSNHQSSPFNSMRSIKSLHLRSRPKEAVKSILSFPNKND